MGIVIGLAVVAGVMACRKVSDEPVVGSELLELRTNQVVIGLEHFVTLDGVRRAHLIADTALFIEDSTTVDLVTVHLAFYGVDGGISSVLTSDRGRYDWDTGDMTGTGHVVVLDPSTARRLETSVLHYDNRRDLIWSDSLTHVFEPDGTELEGVAFESDPGLDHVNLKSARLRKPGARSPSEP
jgi:LPS export ABC transporter protein LptC